MNNADLEAIERQIAERKAVATVEENTVAPVIQFGKNTEKKTVENGKDTAGELVEQAFNQAIVHTVTTDEKLKNDMSIMREMELKPKNFGIRVRNNSEELKIKLPSEEYDKYNVNENIILSQHSGFFNIPYLEYELNA